MTPLRRRMQEELQRRNYSEATAVCYVRHVAEFAQFYETVCFNRQYEARAFDSSEDAEAWLRSGVTA